MMTHEAVIVVDYQNDFGNKETGSLYVAGGELLAPTINQVMRETKSKGGIVLASQELHSQGHISFASNFIGKEAITESFKGGVAPSAKNFITQKEIENWTEEKNGLRETAGFCVQELKMYLQVNGDQALWPNHCEEGKFGSQFIAGLNKKDIDVVIKKGFQPTSHPYSAFGGYTLDEKFTTLEVLKNYSVKLIKVLGLATDYCDLDTVLDARKYGFEVQFITSGSAGVDPAGTIEALKKMREAGAQILP